MKEIRILLLLLVLIGSTQAASKAAKPDSIWLAPGIPAATQDGSEANPFQVSCTADIQEKLDLLDRTRRLCPIAHFLPGTYNAEDTIDVRSRITIAGSGMRSTIFRKGENNKYPYPIFQNANFGGGDQIEIRDLAIDCNLRTEGAIALYGDENRFGVSTSTTTSAGNWTTAATRNLSRSCFRIASIHFHENGSVLPGVSSRIA